MPLLSLLKASPSRDGADLVLLEVTAVVALAGSPAAARAHIPETTWKKLQPWAAAADAMAEGAGR